MPAETFQMGISHACAAMLHLFGHAGVGHLKWGQRLGAGADGDYWSQEWKAKSGSRAGERSRMPEAGRAVLPSW